jgi:glycosyltransferase involved in cell wall biosynthesis
MKPLAPPAPDAAERRPEISVVIPVFNEEAIVAQAAEELCRKLDAKGWDYELLVAENGSTDRTAQILRHLHGKLPRLRSLHEPLPNYGRALRRGMLEARGEIVICDEIDLCDVRFYEQALPLLREDRADMVVGSKLLRGAADDRPAWRHAASIVINLLLRLLVGFRGTDTHGLKAFRKERLYEVVEACIVEKDLFASEFVIRAGRMGRRVHEVPIQLHEKRPPSIHLLRRVPNVLRNLLRLFWVIRVRGR